MKICFVLPRFSRRPIGGYKIVFEYANRLNKKGYEIYLLFLNEKTFVNYKIPSKLNSLCSSIMTQIEPRWFSLNKDIKKISGISCTEKKLRDIDVCVATGAETVGVCEKLFPQAKKIYFIQGFETWVMNEEEIFHTYNAGFKNIVVASWLEKIVNDHSESKAVLIKNPIDLKKYQLKIPMERRKTHTIGLLYHKDKNKGLKYSIAVLKKIKEKYPDLEVYMFGTSEPEENIPGLVKFVKDASVEQTIEIYNKVSVFICSAIKEGFGLTGMEAMACGAALASTAYEGVFEYGQDGINCLLSPIEDVDSMVRNVSRLFEDNLLRYNISKEGRKSLCSFDWDIAVNSFTKVIEDL